MERTYRRSGLFVDFSEGFEDAVVVIFAAGVRM